MPAIAAQKLQPVLSVFWREETLSARGESFTGRLYVPAEVPENAGLVLHLHGGHFNSGSPAEGQAVATALTEAGAVVFSLSYPLAPIKRFPETLERIYAALEALARGAIAGRRAARRSTSPARKPAAISPRRWP